MFRRLHPPDRAAISLVIEGETPVLREYGDPLLRSAAYWHAKAALRDGRPDDAAERLARARRLNDDVNGDALAPEIGYDLGVALERAGRPDDAIEAFERFVDRHTEHALVPEALTSIASLRLQGGEYKEAAGAARRVAEAHGASDAAPVAAMTLGEALYFAGDLDGSRRVLERALEGDRLSKEQRAAASYRLGMALSRLGEHEDAEALLRETAARDDVGAFRPALRALGEGALARERWAEAADWFGRYLDAGEPPADTDDARLRLGLALAREGAHEDAIAAMERVSPDAGDGVRARARFELARSLMALGRDGDAAGLLESLLAMPGGDRFEARALRGECLRAVYAEAAAAPDGPSNAADPSGPARHRREATP